MCYKTFEANKVIHGLINKVDALFGEVSIIHVDAACSSNLVSYGVGGIVGSSFGRILASLSGFYDAFLSILGVEASTTFEGLRLVNRMGITQILVLSDSFTIIQILKGFRAPFESGKLGGSLKSFTFVSFGVFSVYSERS